MAQEFRAFAYIYLGSGQEDPARDRVTIDVGGMRATMVGVPDEASAVDVAIQLAEEGAQAIDLCSAFSSRALADIASAVGPGVGVGRTTYGLEAVAVLAQYQPPVAVP